MATPATGQPILPTMKRSILKFVSGLVSPRIQRAIEIILAPCCEVSITDIDFDCLTASTYKIFVTFDKSTHFPATDITAQFYQDGKALGKPGIYDPVTGTATFESVTLVSTSSSQFQVQIFFPANYDGDVLVSYITMPFTATPPGCA